MRDCGIINSQLDDLGFTLRVGVGVITCLPKLLVERNIKKVFIIADKNTYAAAGEEVVQVLEESGIVTKTYIFTSDKLEPNESAVGLAAMHFDSSVDAIVGVGSGVINDISKIISDCCYCTVDGRLCVCNVFDVRQRIKEIASGKMSRYNSW